jgi:hypothetical protein
MDAAGGVAPVDGLARSVGADSTLTVVMQFDSGSTAASQLEVRQELAKGEAPDQGGTFEERFSIEGADTSGTTVVLTLQPRSPDTQLLRDLGRGGLLFAACPISSTGD